MFDLTADDIEAGAPECHVLHVHSKPLAQRDGIGQAGGREKVVVLLAETIRIVEIAGIDSQAQQQAVGVGIVVKRRAIIVD